MATDFSDAEIEALADRLHSAAIHLLRGLRRQDEAIGLPTAQLSALSVVVFAGPLPLRRLAAAEQVRSPTMSRIVSALERAGLVARRPDPADARSALIAATAAGRRLLMDGRRRRVQDLGARLRELSRGELDALAAAAPALVRVSGAPPTHR